MKSALLLSLYALAAAALRAVAAGIA